MDPEAEGQVASRIAIDVEAIGVRKLRFIAIGGREDRQYDGALGYRRARKLDILGGLSKQHLNRPVEAQPLFDERGTLSIAYSFSVKSGAVFAMIGPEPESAIAVWAEAIEKAPPASEASGDLIAATVALSPAQLQELLKNANPNDANAIIAAGIDLEAGRPPTQLVVRQEAARYVITSQGPAIKKPHVRQGRQGG